jgi:hypothetical protein
LDDLEILPEAEGFSEKEKIPHHTGFLNLDGGSSACFSFCWDLCLIQFG